MIQHNEGDAIALASHDELSNGKTFGPQAQSPSCDLAAIADILLVDDTAYNLRFLAKLLNRRGYEVRKALNSRMALIAINARRPDLILLDVMMPEMDGYELCRRLKANPQTKHIPIIFLTALHDASEKVKAFHLGAADYITKPFQAEEVCARVNHQLELGLLQRQLAQQNQRLYQEQQRSKALLHNLLPASIAERLTHHSLEKGVASPTIAESFEAATILFADIADFTAFASSMIPVELVKLLNRVFSRFDQLAEQLDLEKVKTIGDAYMVAGGIQQSTNNHSQQIARMALEMQALASEFETPDGNPLKLRIGIHRGPVVGGVIGIKRLSYDLWGDTVNVASRMEMYSEPGKIQISEVVYHQLKGNFQIAPRGPIAVKGKGMMNTYWLLGEAKP